ncbi:hypothetical protein ACWF76_22420 [Streptomyces globisporus]
MRWIRGRRAWFPYALAGGVLAMVVAGTVVWFSADRAQQRSDNLRQLDRACAGLLPGERLRGFVPADRAGVLEEYGTMLDPGQESRALLNCTLSWGAGRWEPTHRVRIRAEAQIRAQVQEDEAAEKGIPRVSDFPLPLPPGVTGSTGADDRVEGSEVSASLRVECPGGLRGRKAPSRTLQVAVELPSKADSDYDVPVADHLLAARTAVAGIATDTAANASRRYGCDAELDEPLKTAPLPVNEDEYVTPADAKGTCAGIAARGKTVTRAWESERGTAPYETCALGNTREGITHLVTAHYGPYAEGAFHDYVERAGAPDPAESGQRLGVLRNGAYWTTADCPADAAPAFFTLSAPRDEARRTKADRTYALATLKTFAERSAKAHGCATPAEPSGPSDSSVKGTP